MSDRSDERLDRLEALVADLAARNDRLQADNDALRAEVRAVAPLAPAPALAPSAADATAADATAAGTAPTEVRTVGRRQLLGRGLAAAGVAAAGAVALDATPAAAADGNALILGGNNAATNTTYLIQSAGFNATGLVVGSNGESAGSFIVSGANGTAATFDGVVPGGTGIRVAGTKAHLRFVRSDGRVPPISDTVAHVRGEVVMDAYSNLWYCVGDGTPGTWRVLEGNGSTGAFFPFPAPVRVYDSRPGTTPATGPKTKLSGTRVLDLKLNGGIGAQANSVMLNILLVEATSGAGNFTVWRDGQAKPQANTLVWGGSAGRFSTLAFCNVTNGKVQVNASVPTHLVVDVVGQYY